MPPRITQSLTHKVAQQGNVRSSYARAETRVEGEEERRGFLGTLLGIVVFILGIGLLFGLFASRGSGELSGDQASADKSETLPASRSSFLSPESGDFSKVKGEAKQIAGRIAAAEGVGYVFRKPSSAGYGMAV